MKLKKICILLVIAYFFIPLHFSHSLVERISVSSDGTQANGILSCSEGKIDLENGLSIEIK